MITRVEAGTTRDFTSEELDALRTDKGTSDALNTARRKAGQKGDDVAVRGDDKTLGKTLEARKTHVPIGETIASLVHASEISGALGLHIPLVGKALHGPQGIVLGGVATLAGIHVAMWEMQKAKDELRDAATRDTLHAGMLMSLELPSGFVASEVSRLGVTTTKTAPATKVKDQIAGTPLATTLQLHCDQGVSTAEDFQASGKTKEEFFAMCPKIAERHASDAAFRAGFDALVWASKNAPADAKQLVDDVHQRDARYAAAQIQYRI
jgi:hypothetical protein